jgi:hypothetical protein
VAEQAPRLAALRDLGIAVVTHEPITLHPENGTLVAKISYRAPLLVDNVSENLVAGGCLHAYMLEVELR